MSKMSLEIFLSQNPKLHTDFKNDIYFNKQYAKLYGEPFEFEFKKDNFLFKTIAIKEKIENTKYYDLQSSYGYSGFYSNTANPTFLQQALFALKTQAFKENIIAFFIRFHPFDFYYHCFKEQLDFFTKSKTIVIVATHENIEKTRLNYSPRIRTYVKKARKELNIEICSPYEIKDFKQSYDDTMQRKKADEFYFFNETYFKKLFSLKESFIIKALLKNEILASASFFLCENLAYYHLSANTKKSHANLALLDFFFEYCYKEGINFCILGGGLKENDTLFQFKEKFSNIYSDFHIGGMIFDKEIYHKLCKNYTNNAFLKYRFN